MDLLICEQCHVTFRSKQSLQYHQTNRVCFKSHRICEFCGHKFSNSSKLQYHLIQNVCQKKANKKLILKLKFSHDISEVNKELFEENTRLKTQLQLIKEHPQQVTNNLMTTNIDKQQINLIVPPSFLTVDTLSQLEKLCPNLLHETLTQHPSEFVTYLIKNTNCNPQHPIFNSVKITNQKGTFARISNGKQYVYAPKKRVIADLIENKKSLLQSYVDSNGDRYGEKILRNYQRYMDLLDDGDREVIKELEAEIASMLMNVSDTIMTDEWSQKLLKEMKSWEDDNATN